MLETQYCRSLSYLTYQQHLITSLLSETVLGSASRTHTLPTSSPCLRMLLPSPVLFLSACPHSKLWGAPRLRSGPLFFCQPHSAHFFGDFIQAPLVIWMLMTPSGAPLAWTSLVSSGLLCPAAFLTSPMVSGRHLELNTYKVSSKPVPPEVPPSQQTRQLPLSEA